MSSSFSYRLNSGIVLLLIILSVLATVSLKASAQAQPDTTINWQTCPEQTPSSRRLLSEWTQRVWHQLKKQWNSDVEREEMIQELKRRHREEHRRMSEPFNVPRRIDASQQQSYVVECALINVPLVWNDASENRRLEFFVKRWRIPGRQPKGQLWLLQGGPGAPGSVFDGIAGAYQSYLNDEYDIYVPDYRGTGRSSYLQCSNGGLDTTNTNQIQRCVDEIKSTYGPNGLLAFGATNAANDVMYVANVSKQATTEQVAIYGVSFGTYWLNRILTLFPNQVDTTIFDSVVKPTMSFTDRDDQFNEAGERYIQVCKESNDCNGRFQREFQADVETVMAQVFQKQAGTDGCQNDVYTPDNISRFFATVLADNNYRRLVFPIIFRLNRCGSQDQQWLENVGEAIKELPPPSNTAIDGPAKSSQDVFVIVVTGELTNYPLEHDANYWVQRYSQYPPYFWADFSPSLTIQAQAMENERYHEPLANTYADISKHTKPVLTMQGTLDPQTPFSFAEDWITHYNRANNFFVQFPNAVHATAFSTPTSTDTRYVNNFCGSVVLLEFIKDSSKTNQNCVASTLDYTFNFNSLPNSVSQITKGLPLWDDSDTRPEGSSGSTMRLSWLLLLVQIVFATYFVAFK